MGRDEWVGGARTRAAEKGRGDDLQTPEFAVRSRGGASGSLLKALRRKELAAIREAKNARAVEGVVVGLRRFSPNDDGPFGRITLRPYTRDRTLTTLGVTVRWGRYRVDAGFRPKLVEARNLGLLSQRFLDVPTTANRLRRNMSSHLQQPGLAQSRPPPPASRASGCRSRIPARPNAYL